MICHLHHHHLIIENSKSIWDYSLSIGPILVSLVNIFLIWIIYKSNFKNNKIQIERDRKINLLKTLFIESHLSKFEKVFTDIKTELFNLKVSNLSIEDRAKIENSLLELFIDLRIEFYGVLAGVNNNLHNKIMIHADELQAFLTINIFNTSNDFEDEDLFDSLINTPLVKTKGKIINVLFNYSGD